MRPANPVPLRLYVHLPFCQHKCAYCDFNSVAQKSPPWREYGLALLHELEYRCKQAALAGRRLASIYFGGGTPSLAPPALIADVIEAAARFGLSEQAEISLEANPGSSDAAHFSAYHAAGVNRLSIGVQSLDDGELFWLERVHNASEAVAALAAARRAGFDNINLDLMYGLPGQSLDAWMRNLERAIVLAAEHLSCYQLTIEPQTPLASRHARRPLPLPDEEAALLFFDRTREMLAAAGYTAYEISNYARAGFACRHNDGYWRYDDYIGIGAGAAGKCDLADGGVWRYSNRRTPDAYMRALVGHGAAVYEEERLERQKAAAEAVWLGLRRRRGIDRRRFQQRFGADVWTLFGEYLQPWLADGKMHMTAASLRLSARGLPLADTIATSII